MQNTSVLTHTSAIRYSSSIGQQGLFESFSKAGYPNYQEEVRNTSRVQTQQDNSSSKALLKWKNFGLAAGLIGFGLLLNRIPPRHSRFELLSTRLEDWTKMGLGVVAVTKINEAMDWKPAPWLHALQTVSVLSFIANALSLKRWRHFPLLALMVPPLVQGTHWLSEKTESLLDQSNSAIPRWIPKVGISVASTILGVTALRCVIKADWYKGLTGQSSGATSSQVVGAEAVVCTRCGGQHIICMEEVSDMIGSLGSWLKSNIQDKGVQP